MKTSSPFRSSLFALAARNLLVVGLLCFVGATARAGVTLEVRAYRYNESGYIFYTPLSTNATAPAAELGHYLIRSPQQPASGSWRLLELTATGFETISGSENPSPSFNAMLDQITNGVWTITVTNATSTNEYQFQVNAGTVNSNLMPLVQITAPANNATQVTNQPLFTWSGPATWNGTIDVFDLWTPDNGNNYEYQTGAGLSGNPTSWPCPIPLPDGQNYFNVTYRTNSTSFFTATTPTNLTAQTIPGWITTSYLESFHSVDFNVGQPANPFDASLVARFTFDNPSSPGNDSSGNGNDSNCLGSIGPNSVPDVASPDAAVGSFAREFFGDTTICFTFTSSAFPNLSNAISGSFTVSAWVKTTSSVGQDGDDAFWGMPIWYADNTGADYTYPLSITGSKAAFSVHDENGAPTTIHSTTSVNDGSYHFLAVTRDQNTGLMSLYVDGVLEATATATTAALVPATSFDIAGGNDHFTGLLDDLRIYATNLTAGNIATLFGTPVTSPLADALDGSGFIWSTGGDANWFSQTSVTHDTVDAAQSGAIGDDQSTWIETTVTGPGILSFWWRVDSDDQFNYDYLEFSIQGNNWSQISGDYGWEYYEVHLESGPQTVRWTYWKDSFDSAGADAAWLDEVNFSPDFAPIITFQPIDQANYSGYPATLVAEAIAQPDANWQWYKVGSGAIAGANNKFYAITNSGTASVAGSYYALAYNDIGGVFTRTAVVTYVSAPLPPDWSKAFQNQLTGDFDEPRTNYGIATLVDASGNIYSASSFSGANTFNSTNTFTAGPGRFGSGLFKYTPNGEGIWGRGITNNGNGNSYPQCVARAPGDGVYMSGVFLGTNQIATNILQSAMNASGIYLARFDSGGNVLWMKTITGTNSQSHQYHQLVADPDGNVTLSILGNDFVNFGTTNLLLNDRRGVLVQYDSSGNIRWIEQPSGWIQYMTYQAGRIYGVFGGNETNYIGGLTNVSDRKYVLATLTATNGQALWLHGFGSSSTNDNPGNAPNDIPAVSVAGADVFVTGTSWGSNAAFGPYTVSWAAPNGQYFARFNTNGTPELATSFGGTTTWPWAAAADTAGNVYITGDFDGYATFGDKVISGPRLGGIGDPFRGQMFLAKFDRNGNSLWVKQAQSETSTSFVNVRDLAVAADGVWACGFVNYYANFGTNIANRVYGPVTIIGSPFGFIHYWVGGYLAKVSEAGVVTPPLAVTLANPQTSPTHLQFQFQSQSGYTHAVQYRTNLVTGQTWQTYSNVTGDGGVKIIGVPQSLFSPAQQGFIRISTQ